jgi:hypothetical protein
VEVEKGQMAVDEVNHRFKLGCPVKSADHDPAHFDDGMPIHKLQGSGEALFQRFNPPLGRKILDARQQVVQEVVF